MADVTLSYNGSDILELSDSGSATLKTGGTYCESDIELEYVKPSGGTVTTDEGELVLASNLTNANFFISHNLGEIPDVVEWWIDSQTVPSINSLLAGFFTQTVAREVKFPTTGTSSYLFGIWHSATSNKNTYQEWSYSSTSPYINSVSASGFNICGSDYSIPAGYTIKWKAFLF